MFEKAAFQRHASSLSRVYNQNYVQDAEDPAKRGTQQFEPDCLVMSIKTIKELLEVYTPGEIAKKASEAHDAFSNIDTYKLWASEERR